MGRAGLRMDTWASNEALIAYYQRRGFHLVGSRHLAADPRLPAHYHGIEVALLEEPCGTAADAAARPDAPRSIAATETADTSRAPRP